MLSFKSEQDKDIFLPSPSLLSSNNIKHRFKPSKYAKLNDTLSINLCMYVCVCPVVSDSLWPCMYLSIYLKRYLCCTYRYIHVGMYKHRKGKRWGQRTHFKFCIQLITDRIIGEKDKKTYRKLFYWNASYKDNIKASIIQILKCYFFVTTSDWKAYLKPRISIKKVNYEHFSEIM